MSLDRPVAESAEQTMVREHTRGLVRKKAPYLFDEAYFVRSLARPAGEPLIASDRSELATRMAHRESEVRRSALLGGLEFLSRAYVDDQALAEKIKQYDIAELAARETAAQQRAVTEGLGTDARAEIDSHLRGFEKTADALALKRRAALEKYYRASTTRSGPEKTRHAADAARAYEAMRQLVFETVEGEIAEQLYGQYLPVPDLNPTLHAAQSTATQDPQALLEDTVRRVAAHAAEHAFPRADAVFKRDLARLVEQYVRIRGTRPNELVKHVVTNGHATVLDAAAFARVLHDARVPIGKAVAERWRKMSGAE